MSDYLEGTEMKVEDIQPGQRVRFCESEWEVAMLLPNGHVGLYDGKRRVAAYPADLEPVHAKLEGAITNLGKDVEPPAGWQGRVMDAVAWQERVRGAVLVAIEEYARYAEGNPLGGHAAVADDIATRVASQLASAAPVLSAEELYVLAAIRADVHEFGCLDPKYRDTLDDAAEQADEAMCERAVALLDRLLGVSR